MYGNPINDGDWLCPEGPYRQKIKNIVSFDPRLKQRDPKAEELNIPWPPSQSRIVILRANGTNFRLTEKFTNVKGLQKYLDANNSLLVKDRIVILVEGLSPSLVEVLGIRYDIHPSFFVDHERVVVNGSDAEKDSDDMSLPFNCRWKVGTQSVTLKYLEAMQLSPNLLTIFPPAAFRSVCAETGRHFAAVRCQGKISEVGIVRRKCSFWSKKHVEGGYACVILCDPPLRAIRSKNGPNLVDIAVNASPYNSGYKDFMSQELQLKTHYGPPRTSMQNDLVHYLTQHASVLENIDDPDSLFTFAQKIVTSQYNSVATFMSAILNNYQWELSRQHNLGSFSIRHIEEQWSDIQAWARRFNEYCTAIDDCFFKLGIPFAVPDPSTVNHSSWANTVPDFQFVRARFLVLLHQIEHINPATTGLASVYGNKQASYEQELSLREAERMKALTLVGLVFIPLEYVATIFSMNDRYIPGSKDSWMYFAVALPLVLAVILGYVMLKRVNKRRKIKRVVRQATVVQAPESRRSSWTSVSSWNSSKTLGV